MWYPLLNFTALSLFGIDLIILSMQGVWIFPHSSCEAFFQASRLEMICLLIIVSKILHKSSIVFKYEEINHFWISYKASILEQCGIFAWGHYLDRIGMFWIYDRICFTQYLTWSIQQKHVNFAFVGKNNRLSKSPFSCRANLTVLNEDHAYAKFGQYTLNSFYRFSNLNELFCDNIIYILPMNCLTEAYFLIKRIAYTGTAVTSYTSYTHQFEKGLLWPWKFSNAETSHFPLQYSKLFPYLWWNWELHR